MSLDLKSRIASNQTEIILYDCTGVYDATDNVGGWGAPNKELADIDSSELRITIPGVTDQVIVDVYPTMPNTDDNAFIVSAETLGVDVIKSGIYRTEYRVTDDDSGETFQSTLFSLLTSDIECSIRNLVTSTDVCDLESERSQEILNLDLFLNAAKQAACCGQSDKAQKIIDYLYNQIKCIC